MKLTLEHLSPYLPYGLKMLKSNNEIITLSGVGLDIIGGSNYPTKSFPSQKPILHPISDLTEEDSNYLVSAIVRQCIKSNGDILDELYYNNAIFLFEKHFDVFGLIESGIAIDVNTLEVNPYDN